MSNKNQDFMQEIKQRNGEGVMLRKPESLYERGRSQNLKKFKGYFDMEVKVTKQSSIFGEILCEM